MKYILALLAIILILGCTSTGKAIVKGDNVSVAYIGSFENGTVFDSSVGRAPLEFSAGKGQVIKGFDAAVIGMHVNEEKNITIKPEDAYGPYNANNVLTVPASYLPPGAKAGDTLYSGGRPVRVIDVNNETALIDTNHPLAGKTLMFRIRIVKIN